MKDFLIKMLGGVNPKIITDVTDRELLDVIKRANMSEFSTINAYQKAIYDLTNNNCKEILKEIKEINHILGSNTFQNKFDLTKKTRGWRGMWKVTPEQIELIKKDTRTYSLIAKDYKISMSYVGAIKRNK